MTEAVFAREQIEKLALPESSGRLTFLLAIVSGLAEHVFVSDRPCNGGDGNREQQKPEKLDRQGGHFGSMRGLQSRLGTIRCISARARLAAILRGSVITRAMTLPLPCKPNTRRNSYSGFAGITPEGVASTVTSTVAPSLSFTCLPFSSVRLFWIRISL